MSAPSDGTAAEISRLRRLVDHTLDLVAIATAKGNIIDVNPAYERLLGYPREQALTMNSIDLVYPEDLPRIVEHFRGHLERTGPIPNADVRLRRCDGQWRWFETRVEPLDDGTFAFNARDVTEQRYDRILLDGESRVLDLVANRAPLADVVTAVGGVVDELVDDGLAAVLVKLERELPASRGRAPLVCAPDLPAAWVRDLTIGLMDAETAVEGIDPLLESLAARHRLGCGWSTPIRGRTGRDLGRILVYRASQRSPSRAQRAAFETMARLLTIAVDQRGAGTGATEIASLADDETEVPPRP